MKRYIKSATGLHTYTFNFGDGNSAASRGTDVEHDCTSIGELPNDTYAYFAARFLNELDDSFDASDVDAVFEDYYDEGSLNDISEQEVYDDFTSMDIGGGNPLVYKIIKDGKQLYYDPDLEEEVHASEGYDDDDYDDEDYDDEDY